MEHKQKFNDNAVISALIQLTGSTYQPFKEAMGIAKVQFFSERTFHDIQNKLSFPAINNVYQRHSKEIIERTGKQDKVALIGDGRCDSPGFTATYGTYTVMNENNNCLIRNNESYLQTACKEALYQIPIIQIKPLILNVLDSIT